MRGMGAIDTQWRVFDEADQHGQKQSSTARLVGSSDRSQRGVIRKRTRTARSRSWTGCGTQTMLLAQGLTVASKRPKCGRLWLNDGSCFSLGPERRYHVWAYDFVHVRTN